MDPLLPFSDDCFLRNMLKIAIYSWLNLILKQQIYSFYICSHPLLIILWLDSVKICWTLSTHNGQLVASLFATFRQAKWQNLWQHGHQKYYVSYWVLRPSQAQWRKLRLMMFNPYYLGSLRIFETDYYYRLNCSCGADYCYGQICQDQLFLQQQGCCSGLIDYWGKEGKDIGFGANDEKLKQ